MRLLKNLPRSMAVAALAVTVSLPVMAQNVKFFSWYGTETETYTSQLIEKAKKLGVTLDVEPVVWDQMQPLLQARIAAGTMPDLLDFKGQDIATYAPAGTLLDLTGQEWLKNIPEGARANLKVDGKEYAVPYTAAFQGVFYNRKVFEKHGIKTPTTYAELMEVASALKAKGVTPFATHFKDNWNIGNITMQFAMSEVFNDNPKWGDDLYANKATFEGTEGYRKVFQHVKDLADNSWKDTFSVDFTEASKRFVKGEAAMFVTGTWVNSNLTIDPTFDYGVFPFPGTKAGAKLIFEPNHTWAVSAKTANKAAVLKVLEMVATDKQLAATVVDEAGAYSLINGVKSEKKPRPVDKDIDAAKAANNIIDVSIGNNQIKWAYQEEYSKLIAEWLLGKRSLDDALKGATALRTSVTRAK